MRKNKLTGAIPKAGRKKGNEEKYTVHLTITKKAKLILDKQLRMEKGNFVSGLIEGSEVNNLLKPDVSGSSCDDFTDEEDYIDEPCSICGDIDGMVNPCCAGYDPLHYLNCGYG